MAHQNEYFMYSFLWPRGQAVKTSPFHGGDMGSIPVGVTKYATLAQLVEQLTCKRRKLQIILHLYVETHKVDTANSGKAKYLYMLIPS